MKKIKLGKGVSILSEIGKITDEDLTKKEFEILSAGKKVYRGGVLNITETDLSEMEKNFNNDIVGIQLALDKNHDPEHQAYAWFSAVRKVGNKLVATFKDFTEEGARLIKDGSFKYFSVEIDGAFGKIIEGGSKQIFKNVLRGAALTNRPVDKGITPTFFNENLSNNNLNMNAILKLAEALLAKATITKAEKELFKNTLTALSEEELAGEEVKKAAGEVEAKEEPKAEAKVEPKDEPKDEPKVEPKGDAKLSEKNYTALSEKIKTMESENSKMKQEIRLAKLSEKAVNEIQLSENNKTGLSKEDTQSAVKLFSTLSDDKVAEVISLLSKVKTVQFGEIGSDAAGVKTDLAEKTKATELDKLSKELSEKNGLTYGQAQSAILSEKPELLPEEDA